jgi:cell division septation protein DedD
MAQSYAQRLRKQGLPAKVSQVDLGSKGIWHRVCVGSFPSLAEARRQYKDWEKKGLISDAFLLPLR